MTTSNLGTLLVLCTALMSSVETGASNLVEHRRAEQIHKHRTITTLSSVNTTLAWCQQVKLFVLLFYTWFTAAAHTPHTHTSTFTALINQVTKVN